MSAFSQLIIPLNNKKTVFRCQLAALHFNEQCNRRQALTSTGEKRWKVSHPKYKGGQGIPKKVKTEILYGKLKLLLRAEKS